MNTKPQDCTLHLGLKSGALRTRQEGRDTRAKKLPRNHCIINNASNSCQEL